MRRLSAAVLLLCGCASTTPASGERARAVEPAGQPHQGKRFQVDYPWTREEHPIEIRVIGVGDTVRIRAPHLDTRRFNPALVRITPEVPRLRVELTGGGDTLLLHGWKLPKTRYLVELSPGLAVSPTGFLEADSLSFVTGEVDHRVIAPRFPLVTLRPGPPPLFDAMVTGAGPVQARVWSVAPDEWPGFLEWFGATQRAQSVAVTREVDHPGRLAWSGEPPRVLRRLG